MDYLSSVLVAMPGEAVHQYERVNELQCCLGETSTVLQAILREMSSEMNERMKMWLHSAIEPDILKFNHG